MSITEADSATTAETDFVPVIPGCTPNKYYRVPDGLKALRTKRKVAIVFGYVGERYCGLQWNHLPDYPTIEEALMTALFETDMISRVNMANVKVQQLLNFERASRTDKGVHALCNVVSVALMLPYHPGYVAAQQAQLHTTNTNTNQSGEEGEHGEKKDSNADDESEGTYSCAEAKRLLNLALPPAIHVFDVVPVTRSFNAYLCCGGRKYEYYLPTFALLSKDDYLHYFPSSLAPSQPSLQEVGFVPSANSMCVTGPTRTRQRDEEEDGAPRNNNNTSTSGRKSKGHFPKRKNRRVDVPSSAACVGNIEAPEDENSSSPATTSAEASTNTTSEPPTSLSSTNVVAKHEEDVGAEGTAAAVSDAAALKDDFLDLSTKHATHFHDGLFESMILFREIPHDAMARAATYRIAHDHLEYIRGLFHAYEGTHSFHNFTPGGRGTDASCHRFIRSIEVSDPFLVQPDSAMLAEAMEAWSPSRFFAPDESIARWYAEQLSSCEEADHPLLEEEKERRLRDRMRDHMKKIYSSGIEVVRVELHGQSFMLNQIRKMIGAVICMSACGMDASHVQNHLLKKGVRRGIPMAPANGLFLSYLDFSGYNSRLARIQRDGNNGSGKDGLDVARIPDEELEVQRQHIIATILRNEMAEDVMGKWMRSLRHVLRLAWVVDLP